MGKMPILNHAIAFVLCLTLLLFAGNAFSGQAASQPVTNKPISGKTTNSTTPLPSTVTTPAMEYQQVDPPPIKKTDIPEYDLAGKFSDIRVQKKSCAGCWTHIFFRVSLKNQGTHRISASTHIPISIRLINRTTDTIIRDYRVNIINTNSALTSEHWVVMEDEQEICFYLGKSPAPETISEVKLIVDIDPDNAYKEAQRHRGNNRCVASW
jgi:hypothetical protein